MNQISYEKISEIINYESKFINDSEHIFSFIDEVSRKYEMVQAINKGSYFPKSNWIHSFSGFDEIIQVLKNELSLTYNLDDKVLLENLNMNLFKI